MYQIEQNINLFLIQGATNNFLPLFQFLNYKSLFMKQQAKRLFYIGKQIKCTNKFQQIMKGLQKSRAFIREVTILQPLNTLIMSLINLFTETSYSYIRKYITEILLQSSSFITQLPSRQDIITSLTQKLKSNDFLIRILILQIIEGLHKLFHKDTSVYHSLFSKLKWKKQLSQKQCLMIIRALKSLLQNSQYLAEVFHNNIKQLSQLGQIEVKIIAYLCFYAKFQQKSYQNVLVTLWQLILEKKAQKNKCVMFYFAKLIVKACSVNYLCIELYYKSFKAIFPDLENKINKIQWQSYNFLQSPINLDNNIQYTHKQILDYCYQYYNIETQITNEVNQAIANKVIEDINMNNLTHYSVLLTFYLTQQKRQINQFDQTFAEKISLFKINRLKQFDQYKKLLKVSLVTANYRLSHKLLQYFLNNTLSNSNISALMLFTCYVQWKLQPDANKFYTFLRVLENLAQTCSNGRQKYIIELCQLWRNLYKNNFGQEGEGQYQRMLQYRVQQTQSMVPQSVQNQLKNKKQIQIKCQQQLKFVKYNKFIMAPPKIKNQNYNKIYFTKKTISDIFLYL